MRDILAEAKDCLANGIKRHCCRLSVNPLPADQWIVSSVLQKAIRRGEVELAQRAALTFYHHRKSALWRRLMVIAFEDVGAGSADALAMTVAAGTDPAFRKNSGGDVALALHLARLLAEAPKDRSADYLICGARGHPRLEGARNEYGSLPMPQRLRGVITAEALPRRALAAWFASGIEWGRDRQVGPGDLPGLMDAFRQLGVPQELVEATRIAAVRTREPITVMVPLVWVAAHQTYAPAVEELDLPSSPNVAEIPLYALDMHTRVGREAIGRFARENDAMRGILERWVPERCRRETAMIAAFYADAAPLKRRLKWSGSAALESYGIETDFLKVAAPAEAHQPLLTAARENLAHLNAIRAEVYRKRAGAEELAGPGMNRLGVSDGDLALFSRLDRK